MSLHFSHLPFYCRSFHYNADNKICLLSAGVDFSTARKYSSGGAFVKSKALSHFQEICLDSAGNALNGVLVRMRTNCNLCVVYKYINI
jgi:hypothetical protein